MFRSFASDVVAHRSLTRYASNPRIVYRHSLKNRPHPSAPSLQRFLSSPSPRPPTQENSSPPIPISTQRKPKIDLRPGPIKPKNSTLSATHTPTKPTQSPSPPSTSPTLSLGTVKETAKRDIEDAEAHGILTPAPPDANWFKRTMHKGIQLAKFYYRGVKLIFIRRKEISIIMARIRDGGSPLSRWENRFIRTQKDDINKVIPFLFIALLLEEVIPLIAIYAPFMLPSTCILPSQRERIEEKKTAKATAYASHYRTLFAQLERKEAPAGQLSLSALSTAESSTAICGLLRLSTVGIDALRIRRIQNHLKFIGLDDQLLLQDGLMGRLSEKNLNEALQERGIISQGLSLKDKESRLKRWLESVEDTSSESALTSRLLLLVKRQ